MLWSLRALQLSFEPNNYECNIMILYSQIGKYCCNRCAHMFLYLYGPWWGLGRESFCFSVLTLYVRDANPFHELFSVSAANFRLQHVRHVKQRTLPASMKVRRRYTVGVFDRHHVASKRYHFTSMTDVKLVQSRFFHIAPVWSCWKKNRLQVV